MIKVKKNLKQKVNEKIWNDMLGTIISNSEVNLFWQPANTSFSIA